MATIEPDPRQYRDFPSPQTFTAPKADYPLCQCDACCASRGEMPKYPKSSWVDCMPPTITRTPGPVVTVQAPVTSDRVVINSPHYQVAPATDGLGNPWPVPDPWFAEFERQLAFVEYWVAQVTQADCFYGQKEDYRAAVQSLDKERSLLLVHARKRPA